MSDLYQTITDRIVSLIENGQTGTWRCPWHSRAGAAAMEMPQNVTGRLYRGINVPLLWCTAQENGYTSPVWGTYKQWQERGAQVRKGEKSTLIVFWKQLSFTEQGDDGEEKTSRPLVARGYAVFNVAQVDNYAAKERKASVTDLSDDERIAAAETFFAMTGSTLRHGGNRAYYNSGLDFVQMPEFGQFKDGVSYYATLGHEHIHWTGHKSRCEREFGARFGDKAYAFEELVAELGAAYLCAHLGLSNEPRADHAAYIASWLGVLKADKKAIFTAASKAQGAMDYLLGLQADDKGAATPEPKANIIYLPPPASLTIAAAPKASRIGQAKGKAFSVTALRGKGVYPAPVAVAEFAGGEKIRMSFFQEQGRPWNIAKARQLLAQTIGNERGRNGGAAVRRRQAAVRALAENPGTPSEGEAAKAALARLAWWQENSIGHVFPPATDFCSFHIEHGGRRIDDNETVALAA